jgi:hypothetical protein
VAFNHLGIGSHLGDDLVANQIVDCCRLDVHSVDGISDDRHSGVVGSGQRAPDRRSTGATRPTSLGSGAKRVRPMIPVALLEPILAAIKGGEDTRDVRNARALLAEIG